MVATLRQLHQAEAEAARRRARIALGGAYEFDSFTDGDDETWRVRIGARNAEHISIRVPPRFPYELPDVFVEGPPLVNVVPHVDGDNKLCYCDEATASFRPEDASRVALWVVDECVKVLDKDPSGIEANEFAEEFNHYWDADGRFLALLRDLNEPRTVSVVWLDRKASHGYSFLVCDDVAEGLAWIKRSGLGKVTFKGTTLFVPDALSMRPPYPSTNREVYDALSALPGKSSEMYEALLRRDRREALIITTACSKRGQAVLAVRQQRSKCPTSSRASGRMHGAVPGFRPGHHPLALEMHGWGADARVERYQGERVDLDRLVSRTIGTSERNVFRHLVLVGAGALGSQIAMELVQSHQFERISIVDPDVLKVENVLRHACGFDEAWRWKAEALGRLIGRNCPWLAIDAVVGNVLDHLDEFEGWLDSADLILFATGVDSLERTLVGRLLARPEPHPMIHRVWLTPNAERGHLVRYAGGGTGCPICSPIDIPPAPDSVAYEPGCSAGFARFGGSRLRRFVAVASDGILSDPDGGYDLEWVARADGGVGSRDEVAVSRLLRIAVCPICGD